MMPTSSLPTSFFKRLLFSVKISGESGWPNLVSGKNYFASCVFPVRVGNFIVFRNPKNPDQILVKKVKRILPGGYEVESTVSWGTGSAELGLVPRSLLLGRLIK